MFMQSSVQVLVCHFRKRCNRQSFTQSGCTDEQRWLVLLLRLLPLMLFLLHVSLLLHVICLWMWCSTCLGLLLNSAMVYILLHAVGVADACAAAVCWCGCCMCYCWSEYMCYYCHVCSCPLLLLHVHTFLHVLLTSCVHLSCEGYTIIPIPFVAFAVVADK